MIKVKVKNKEHEVYESNIIQDYNDFVRKVKELLVWDTYDYKYVEMEKKEDEEKAQNKRYRVYYSNIPFSLDIETSSFYNEYCDDGSIKFFTNKAVECLCKKYKKQVFKSYLKKIRKRPENEEIGLTQNDLIEEAKVEALAAVNEYKNRFQPRACMYIWQFACKDFVIIGRTWEDFIRFISLLRMDLQLDERHQLICYIHNASYEFQFIKSYFIWEMDNRSSLFNNKIVYYARPMGMYVRDDDFATGSKIISYNGIVFKDSLCLAGVKEEKLPDIMKNKEYTKLVGNLDYEKVRHGGSYKRGIAPTPLTNKELAYCIYDVLLLNKYIEEKALEYKTIKDIPMTKTEETRIRTRAKVLYTNGVKRNLGRDKKFQQYREFLDNMKMNFEQYQMTKRAYAGGFTHANYIHACEIILDQVKSIDIASSFPAVICCKKFPMSPYQKVEIHSYEELAYYLQNYACLFNVHFKNIRPRYNKEKNLDMGLVDSIISISKVEELGQFDDRLKPIYLKGHTDDKQRREDMRDFRINNNGRLRQAESIFMTINEIDFANISKFYVYDDVGVDCFYVAEKDYLPKDIIKAVLDMFYIKTRFKPYDGEDSENGLKYNLSKVDINSIYGVFSTDLLKPEYTLEIINDVPVVKPITKTAENNEKMFAELEERLNKRLDSKNSFSCYQWSHTLTSHARANIFKALEAAGTKYVYSDTDSLYYIDCPEVEKFVEEYNSNIDKEMNACFEYRGIKKDSHKASYTNKEGKKIEKCLGYFEKQNDDECYKKFVVNHAKCYLKETYKPDKNGETLHLTVAGLSKKAIHYMAEKYGDELFERFRDSDIYVDGEHTNKMMATYIDFSTKGIVKDYLGNVSTFAEMSSVHLEKIPFDMHQTETYQKLVDEGKIVNSDAELEERVYEGL